MCFGRPKLELDRARHIYLLDAYLLCAIYPAPKQPHASAGQYDWKKVAQDNDAYPPTLR